MKIPDFISDYGGCGCCSTIGTKEMEKQLIEWVQSRERKAISFAAQCFSTDKEPTDECLFQVYLNSKDYEK